MILRFLFYAFLIYLAYKLVFDLVIPLYRTTRKIKRGFREMQDHMRQQANGGYPSQNGTTAQQNIKTENKGDYIEFEEIK